MPQQSPPTQQFVAIREIRDGVVHLKHGGLRKVLIVSGVNFDLKSEAEQGLILNVFQNFLNTLDFPVQFFIHSRKVNVDGYLERMRERGAEEPNELLKIQISEYVEFIRSFVAENAIISKTFFVVVPYHVVSLEKAKTGFLSKFLGPQKKPASGEPTAEDVTMQENLRQLDQRVSQVVEGLAQNGLRAVPLEDEELTELFYNLYNPQLVEKRKLEIAQQK